MLDIKPGFPGSRCEDTLGGAGRPYEEVANEAFIVFYDDLRVALQILLVKAPGHSGGKVALSPPVWPNWHVEGCYSYPGMPASCSTQL